MQWTEATTWWQLSRTGLHCHLKWNSSLHFFLLLLLHLVFFLWASVRLRLTEQKWIGNLHCIHLLYEIPFMRRNFWFSPSIFGLWSDRIRRESRENDETYFVSWWPKRVYWIVDASMLKWDDQIDWMNNSTQFKKNRNRRSRSRRLSTGCTWMADWTTRFSCICVYKPIHERCGPRWRCSSCAPEWEGGFFVIFPISFCYMRSTTPTCWLLQTM